MIIFFTIITLIFNDGVRTLIEDLFAVLSIVFAENLCLILGLTGALAVSSLILKNASNKDHSIFFLEAESKCMEGSDSKKVRKMRRQCILLDENDNVIGHDTKKNCHLNSNIYGKHMLHRAFSVYIFNSKTELLMQKRSNERITFPKFWTTSCCSHPLYSDDEMIMENYIGVKNAARRKIEQELGILPDALPLNSFHFITRVHYKAKSNEIWGKHAIDYILFCIPPKDVFLNPNPNKVSETGFFSKEALKNFIKNSNSNGDLISPWFKVINKSLLPRLWDALLQNRLTDQVEENIIHRLERKSNIERVTLSPISLSKQRGYRKISIHRESVFSQAIKIHELYAMINLKFMSSHHETSIGVSNVEVHYLNEILKKTGRSFSLVFKQLPEELRLTICVFYLVLRALDAIEDDTESFDNPSEKIKLLQGFHKILGSKDCDLSHIGEGDEKNLLRNFFLVSRAYTSLDPSYQSVIKDITYRMGDGMGKFVEKCLDQGTNTIVEYNDYSFYVAGLVGEGLSSIFTISGRERMEVAASKTLSHSMGLFLQKVNFIRDYLEDYVDGRSFWPQEIWKKYVSDLGDLSLEENQQQSLLCLNEMIEDAIKHVPDCIAYLGNIKDETIFPFCAIPQVIAIATLEKMYNNPDVFTGVVTIRKGLAARIILGSRDISSVHAFFLNFMRRLAKQTANKSSEIHTVNSVVKEYAEYSKKISGSLLPSFANTIIAIIFILLLGYMHSRYKERGTLFPRLTETFDVTLLGIMFAVTTFLFAFTGVPFVLPSTQVDDTLKHSKCK